MQDDPDKKSDTQESIKRGLSFVEQSSAPSLKLERSRTITHSGRFKTRGQKIEAMLGNGTKISADKIPSVVMVDVSSVQSISSSKESVKPIINDLTQSRHKNNHGNGDKQKSNSEYRVCDKQSEKGHGSIDKNRHSADQRRISVDNVRGSFDRSYNLVQKPPTPQEKLRNSHEFKTLPKPKPPSQQYLKESSTNSPIGSRSLPSPRTTKEISKEFDHSETDWLTRR